MLLAQISFSCLFSLIVFFSLVLSSAFKQQVKPSIFVLISFSLLVVLANIFDFFHFSPVIYFSFLLIALVFVLYKKYRKLEFKLAFKLWSAWQVLLILLFIPLLTVLPKDAVVTGHGVSNDSVHHSFFIKGFKATKQRLGIDSKRHANKTLTERTTFLGSYPRGAHSFLYYFSKILPYYPPEYLLAASLSLYSLSFFALISFFQNYSISVAIISALSLLSFLPVISSYHLFFPQMACFPFVLSFLAYLLSRKNVESLFAPGLLLAAGVSIYGVFSLSLCAFGFLLWAVLYAENQKGSFSKFCLIFLSASLISFPSMFSALKVLWLEFNDSSDNALLRSPGNLSTGFLSPAHLSGLWFDGKDYRDSLASSSSLQLSGLIIIIQVFFATLAILKRKEFQILLLTLLIPLVASVSILKNPYINFKYLSIFVPVFVFISMLGLFEIKNNRAKLLSVLIYIPSFIVLTTFSSLPAFASIPILRLGTWLELKGIKQNYFDKGSAIVLTKEDWVQEFIIDSSDSAPLTQYLPRKSYDEPDYLVIDDAYKGASKQYFATHPRLFTKINSLSSTCVEKISERFYVYNLSCSYGKFSP